MSLFSDLGTLESAGLIRVAKVEPDLEYNFLHTLVQDAAYASLLESDRRRLHQAVGDAIVSLYPNRQHELAALLGYHYREAGQDEKALRYYLMAGDEALGSYANQEAEIQYQRALELSCCSKEDIAKLYSGLGEALFRQSRFDDAIEAIRKGIVLYMMVGNNDEAASLYSRLGRIDWYKGDRPEGLRVCLEGLEMFKDAPDSKGKSSLMHETARAYYFNQMSDKALPLCRQALAVAEKFGVQYLQADALATLGILPGVAPQEALDALQKSVDLAEANGYFQVGHRAHVNLGSMVRAWQMDNDGALNHFYRSAELGRMRGSASEEVLGLVSYTSCLFSMGRLGEVDAMLPQLDALVERIPNSVTSELSVKFIYAAQKTFRGDWEGGISAFRELLRAWQDLQNVEAEYNLIEEITWFLLEKHRWGEAADLQEIDDMLMPVLAEVSKDTTNDRLWVYERVSLLRAYQGRVGEAKDFLDKVGSLQEAVASPWIVLAQLECEMEIALAEKNWSDALEVVEKLASLQLKYGLRAHWSRTVLCWADIHIRRGEPADIERARILLRESLTTMESMGFGHYPDIIKEKQQTLRTRSFAQALDHEKMTRDLKKARKVQESLLPQNLPVLNGWELEVMIKPAYETSGDFYDFLRLTDGRLGFIIADVTDKGTSAALFMALSRSLWRTFAATYPDNPEKTVQATNERILADTHGGLYITLFYGILDPTDGTLTYCSAGHHPAYIQKAADGSIQSLSRTGIPLGVLNETGWASDQVVLEQGDTLVLYTDGITDAMNASEAFFGLERLQGSLQKHSGDSARQIMQSIMADVHEWVGDAPQFDDISLMVIKRETGILPG